MLATEVRLSNAVRASYQAQAAWSGSSALVAWIDDRVATTQPQVYVRRVAADGTALGAELQISAAPPFRSPSQAAVTWTGSEFGVAWSQATASGTTFDIHLVRFAADGTVVGPDVVAVAAAPSSSGDIHLGFTTALGYFIVRQLSSSIVFQPLGPTGTTAGMQLTVSTTTAISLGAMGVAVNPAGEIGVLWIGGGLQFRIINADGSVTASVTTVTLPLGYSTSGGGQPVLAHDGTTWVAAGIESSSTPAPTAMHVVAYRGPLLGSRVVLASNTPSVALRRWPSLTIRGSEAIVGWQTRSSSSETVWNIVGRRLALPAGTGAATPLDAGPQVLMSTTSVADEPFTSRATPSGLLLAWSDVRWGDTEVYSQGVVLPPCGP